MRMLRLMTVVSLLPIALVGCQSSKSSTNAYGGNTFNLAGNDKSPALGIFTPSKKRTNERRSSSLSDSKANNVVSSAKIPTAELTPRDKLATGRNRYYPIIAKHAKAQGVPVKLAVAVVQIESNYRPNARGAAGEVGLMQLLPNTARYIGYQGKMKHLYNPETNIAYGMKYLGKAHRLGGGSTCGTILKYNAGHGAKRMNETSRKYCARVKRIMRQI